MPPCTTEVGQHEVCVVGLGLEQLLHRQLDHDLLKPLHILESAATSASCVMRRREDGRVLTFAALEKTETSAGQTIHELRIIAQWHVCVPTELDNRGEATCLDECP